MVKRERPWVNFGAYRHPRYMLAVYAEFGATTLVYSVESLRAPCPLCRPGMRTGRELAVCFTSCSWYCQRCKKGGDAIQLVRELTGATAIEAAIWLEERGGVSGSGVVLTSAAPSDSTRDSTTT